MVMPTKKTGDTAPDSSAITEGVTLYCGVVGGFSLNIDGVFKKLHYREAFIAKSAEEAARLLKTKYNFSGRTFPRFVENLSTLPENGFTLLKSVQGTLQDALSQQDHLHSQILAMEKQDQRKDSEIERLQKELEEAKAMFTASMEERDKSFSEAQKKIRENRKK